MKNASTLKTWTILALSTLAVLGATRPTPAVVLEQKWQAGQQLSYDFKLDGTLNLTAPAGVPMIGGLPLEILLKGDGQSTLDTREVDDLGSALIAPRLERMQLKFNETTFNQNGVLSFRDGRANFSMNGQAVAPPMDWSELQSPRFGVRITKQMHVVGAQPLMPLATEPTTKPPVKTDQKAAAKKARPGLPFDFPAMMQALMARALPSFWPARDLSPGDTWKADVVWPQPPGAERPEFKGPAASFDFKLLNEEELLGRKTWHIALDGTMNITEKQSQVLREEAQKYGGEATPGKGEARATGMAAVMPNFFSSEQTMSGDLWFDAVAGQLVRADVHLQSNAVTRKAAGGDADGKMNFAGNFQMELSKVSIAAEVAR